MDFPQVNHGLLTCYLLQIAPTYEDYNGVLKSLLEIDAGYHVKIPAGAKRFQNRGDQRRSPRAPNHRYCSDVRGFDENVRKYVILTVCELWFTSGNSLIPYS